MSARHARLARGSSHTERARHAGGSLAIAEGGQIALCDLTPRRPLTTLAPQQGFINQLRFSPGDGELQFCYTTGLSRYDLPELVVFGPCPPDASRLLNTLGARMRAGRRYADGDAIDDVWPRARLMEVLDSREHLVMAHALARATGPLPALQVIYPDRDGQWIVEDLGSTNGTYLDRSRLTPPTPIPLGAPIRIGKTVIELRK